MAYGDEKLIDPCICCGCSKTELASLRAEVEALTVALRRIRGWREVDLPEGNRCARAIEYIEQVADYALRGEGE